MNLTQLLVTQQNVDEISARFGLSEEQTLEAMAAVIPAFSEGLKRQTRTPQGASGFIEALASGRHAQYGENPASATSTFGINDGNAILGHLFGNKDVSRAIASNATEATGIGSGVIKSLLPALASMVMGALFKNSAGHSQNLGAGMGGGTNGGLLGQLIEGVAGGLLSGGRSSGGSGGALEGLLGEMLGGGQSRRRTRTNRGRQVRGQRRRRSGNSGLEDAISDGLGGIFGQLLGENASPARRRRKTSSYSPQPKRKQRRTQRSPGIEDIFGQMFDSDGRESPDYRRKTVSVFDEFLGG